MISEDKRDVFSNPTLSIFLKKLEDGINDIEQRKEILLNNIPIAGYSIPMAFRCAISKSNSIVDHVRKFSSADHGSYFKSLMVFVCTCLNEFTNTEDFTPYFYVEEHIDPTIEELVELEYIKYYIINVRESLMNELWEITDIRNRKINTTLSPKIRRSGLTLLSMKADFLSRNKMLQRMITNKESYEPVRFMLKNGIEDLRIITQSVPGPWASFLSIVKIEESHLSSFLGFIAYLSKSNIIWFSHEDIWEIWGYYSKEYKQETISKESFIALVDAISISPEEALSWGFPSPLIRIGSWYVHWFFAFHVMHPSLLIISLLSKKYSDAWNNSVGSAMGNIASTLGKRIPKYKNLLIADQRKKKKLGDIDLAIYDKKTKHLFLCEIKTVFDRFRTNYQLDNFVEQRVNFDKANKQLRNNEKAIRNGIWKIADIFGQKITEDPKTISLVILTWWDILNSNLETQNKDIHQCNFLTFIYLVKLAKGNLDNVATYLKIFSEMYCVAVVEEMPMPDINISLFYERQTDLLAPLSKLERFCIDETLSNEIKTLQKFPEDWKTQLIESGEIIPGYKFY